MTLSALLRSPNEVIDKLDEGDVLLTRRGGESLRLSKARDAEEESSAIQVLAQLIAASLDDDVCDRLAHRLSDPYPWLAFLPVEQQREFVGEFLRVARACASVGRFERLTILLAAWQATAEAYADPSVIADGSDLEYLPAAASADEPRRGGRLGSAHSGTHARAATAVSAER